MSGPRPAIVVSLPARSVPEAVAEIAEARAAGADAAEVRVDRFSSAERGRLAGLFPSPLPLLATLRSAAQGGDGPNDPVDRAAELLRLVQLPFRWIDLEYGRDDALAVQLPPEAKLGRIVSSHLRANEFPRWAERRRELAGVEGVGKLVVPASVPAALGEMLPQLLASRDESVVVHTTGPSGPLLRALGRRLGAPFVYAALPVTAGRIPVEPSQIPVDRLRPFLEADGEPPLFGVGGRPIAHSMSPEVHGAWMRADRHPGLYVPLEFSDEREFLASVPLLAENGFRGLNVTHPFKSAAFEAATEAAPSATTCGAANCLTFREGEVAAENTDLAAILRRLEELRRAGEWDGDSLAVLGAGGAARATLAAARVLSAPATVFARRRDAAQALAREFGATVGDPHDPPRFSLAVHATSAGRAETGPLDPTLILPIGRSARLLDWVYRPAQPQLQELAERAGASYEDGWRLFIYQAAASYAIWWGDEPSPALIARTVSEGECAA